MKHKAEDIDPLLRQNLQEQLAKVDWRKLNADISDRLDKAEKAGTAASPFSSLWKFAACIGVAGAVVFAAILITITNRPGLHSPRSPKALVRLEEQRGSASVQIGTTYRVATAEVRLEEPLARSSSCVVEINETIGLVRPAGNNASWSIIKKSARPAYADNGLRYDKTDVVCLF